MAFQMKRCFAAILVLSAALWVDRAAAATVEVVEYQCSRKVADLKPIGIVDCKSFRLPSPVYLWVLLRGDGEALDLLEQGHPIIIRHKWVRFTGPNPDVDTETAHEDVPAGQISPEYFAQLRLEVATSGYFTWRTWTKKDHLRKTSYRVDVLNQSLNSISCSPDGSQDKCSVKVIIGR